MAEGQGGSIKGIGIAVTADASQIKRVFNEAIQGFQSKTIEITLTAKEDKSFEQRFKALREQEIEIGVSLKPTRQTIRDFRKDFNERLDKEGGVLAPVKAKGITQAEGRVLRKAITDSIGQPVVKVLLEWAWKDGPPPTSFAAQVRPPGPGGGPTEAWGPVRPAPSAAASTQDVNAFIRQEVARRMAAQGTGGGGGPRGPGATLTIQAGQEKEQPRATAQADPNAPTKRARKPRKPHRYDQREGESTEEWTARLLEEHGQNTEKLSSKSTDVARRANNRLVQLEKRLGIDSDRETQVVPGRSVIGREGKTTTLAPAADQPRPTRTAEGKLLSDAISEGYRQAQREGVLGPTPGTVAAQRAELQKSMGIKLGPSGVEDLGQLASLTSSAAGQNALIERINDRIFGDEPDRQTGFRGGGRVTRSAFSGQEAEMEFVGTPGPSERINAPKQRQIVDTGAFIDAFIAEAQEGMRLDPRADAQAMAALAERWTAQPSVSETYAPEGSPERARAEERIRNRRWGTGFATAERFRQSGNVSRAVFGDRVYNAETGRFDIVPEGEKLPSGEVSEGFEGALYARAQLDAAARNKKLPGVGPAAVRYAQAETRDDMPRGITEAGMNYISQRDALTSIISDFFEGRRIGEDEAAASAAGQQAAATVAEALNPPVRPIVARRREGETLEQYRARKAETLEPYNAAVERYEARQAKLMAGQNDPSLMTYPAMASPPRQGLTAGAIEGVRRPTDPAGQTHTMYSGVGAFVPFRPTAPAQPQMPAGVQYASPEQLAPFAEIDRELKPKLASDPGYLDRLEKEIRDDGGIKVPLQLDFDPESGTALLADGNHRLAVAKRMGLDQIPYTVNETPGIAGIAPFSGQMAQPAAAQPGVPDLSDLGFTPEQVMAALSEPAMAAGGVAPPPVPPGTVSGGGEGAGWTGGVVPVRVVNFGELKGMLGGAGASEPVAAGPSAEIPAAEAPTEEVGKTRRGGRKKKAVTAQEAVTEPEEPAAAKTQAEKALPPIGRTERTFRHLDPDLDKAEKAVTSAERALEQARMTPEANLEGPLKKAIGTQERLASMLSGRGAAEAAAGPEAASKMLAEELDRIQIASTPGPTPDRPDVLPPGTLSAQIKVAQRAGTLSLEQGEALQARRLERVSPIAGARQEVEEQLAMSRQGLPIRSAPVSVAQLVAGPTRGRTTARLAEAGDALRSAEQLDKTIFDIGDKLKLRESEQKNINDAIASGVDLTEEQLKRQAALPREVKNLEAELKKVNTQQSELVNKAVDLSKLTTGEKLANLRRSFTGNIAGTLIYGTALGAVTGGLAALAAATAPVIERTLGYKQATAATTSELSKQVAASGQLAETLTAQRLAAANMNKTSAERIQSIIAERSELMAANQQITEQTKLYGAAAEIQRQNITGLGDRGAGRTRFGSDINLYESTGGIGGTSLMAPGFSTQEALQHRFDLARTMLNRANPRTDVDPNDPWALNSPGQVLEALLPQNWGRSGEARAGFDERFTEAEVPAELDEFAGALKAAREELELGVASNEEGRQKVAAFADALDRADMQGWATAVRNGRIFIEGLDKYDPEQQARILTEAAENYAKGIARRDPAQLIEGMADQISAAVQGSAEQARIERELNIPAQRGLARAAAPFIPIEEQDILMAPAGDRSGLAPEARPAFARAEAASSRAMARQQDVFRREQVAIDELFKPLGAGVKAEYMEIRQNIGNIGRELAALQNEQVNIQINLSTQQFHEQLRQVRRALADARERATGVNAGGNEGAGANLGLLEHRGIMLSRQAAAVGFQQQALGLQSQALQLQNQLLGRRSQMLSFQSTELGFQSKELGFQLQAMQLAQNQRKINFQVAVAGFTAPGMTGEERAARIAEAKVEADFAQRQQDIAVRQFAIAQEQYELEQSQFGIAQQQFALDGQQLAIQQQAYVLAQQQYGLSVAQFQNQQAIIDAQNARAVEDLEIQERLIGAAMAAQQQLAANEKTIAALRAELEAEMQAAGSYLQQASGVATQIAQASAALIAQFGGDLQTMLTAYADAWIGFRQRVLNQAPRGSFTPSQTRYSSSPELNAEGAIGMVTSATRMIAGEAGGEFVAILRNPRPMAVGVGGLGGGGGGGFTQINVNVTGNTVRNDDDLDQLAALVGRKVEESMGRRASQLGVRAAR